MEQVSIKSYKAHFILPFSIILLISALYSPRAKANTLESTSIAGQQLAYFIGYHSAPGYIYYGPRHHRNFYWTGWRYVGHGCRKNCLVDRWNGRVIRCNRICRRYR
ncbi:MAG: hypothetical protein QM652_06275 [Legionella sp.]|uniref:hypothetical protein n=1 Tax=Legionella sp. TaxID=459 RepID=UPI0039E60F5B